MAKVKETNLTFSVTIPQPKGVSIQDVRALIVDGVKAAYHKVSDENFTIKCHLTNKEVHYG